MARRGLWVGVKAGVPTLPAMERLVNAINDLEELLSEEPWRDDVFKVLQDIKACLAELQKAYIDG